MQQRAVPSDAGVNQPIAEGAATLLAMAAMLGEQLVRGARWLVSRLLLVGGVVLPRAGGAARTAVRGAGARLPAVLAVTPAWVMQGTVLIAGGWLAVMSSLVALRAALGPESGAEVLSATGPSLVAMLLGAAGALLAIHRIGRSSRDPLPAVTVGAAAVVLAVG